MKINTLLFIANNPSETIRTGCFAFHDSYALFVKLRGFEHTATNLCIVSYCDTLAPRLCVASVRSSGQNINNVSNMVLNCVVIEMINLIGDAIWRVRARCLFGRVHRIRPPPSAVLMLTRSWMIWILEFWCNETL